MREHRKLMIILTIFILSMLSEQVFAQVYFFDIWGHWAEDRIIWATNEARLFKGYEDDTFRPDKSISRTEFIAILHRAAKKKGLIPTEIEKLSITTLTDDNENKEGHGVDNGEEIIENASKETNEELKVKQTEEAVDQGKHNQSENEEPDNVSLVLEQQDQMNILSQYVDLDESFWGYGDIRVVAEYIDHKSGPIGFNDIFIGNEFRTNKPITREEAAVLSSFFTSLPIQEKGTSFKDISKNYKFYEQIMKLSKNRIIKGYSDKTFRPKSKITRAEAATIIKRIFFDMDYLTKKYLEDVRLIETIDDHKYMLFGSYDQSSDQLSHEDLIYKKAIATLDYLSLVKYIPYEERRLYDPNPIATLEALKDSDYWNEIGLNYYLLENSDTNPQQRERLAEEMLDDFLKRDDITGNQSKVIFEKITNNSHNYDEILQGLNKWSALGEDIIDELNILFFQTKVYRHMGQLEKVLPKYEEILLEEDYMNTDVMTKHYYLLNKGLVYAQLGKLDASENVLRQGKNYITTEANKRNAFININEIVNELDLTLDGNIFEDVVVAKYLVDVQYITDEDFQDYKTLSDIYIEFIGALKQIEALKNNNLQLDNTSTQEQNLEKKSLDKVSKAQGDIGKSSNNE